MCPHRVLRGHAGERTVGVGVPMTRATTEAGRDFRLKYFLRDGTP